MRQSFLTVIVLAILGFSCASAIKETDEEQFISNLLSKMTLEEKIGQLHQITSQWEMTGPAPATGSAQYYLEHLKTGKVGSMLNVTGAAATLKAQKLVVENSRLGIPLIFGYDVIHGYQTMFPVPLGEAASWNPELLKLSASIAAKESAAAGLHWTFAPMMDVGRDPRWGRVMEGAGEDPYLATVLSVARVEGFQGDDLNNDLTIAACAKHFAGYAFVEAGRDYNITTINDKTLHNVVLPPFKAAAEAGALTFMNAFNTIQGLPATANTYIQRDLLKDKWDFDGFIVSDWNSIGEMVAHGAAEDLKRAAELAINAGSDMDMEGNAYIAHLKQLVEDGKVDEKLIDDAVKRVLRAKYRLGLFEDPYRYSDSTREKSIINAPENHEAARKVARESMVLLKNEGSLLPIKSDIKSIAVIGPLADDKDTPLGNWRAKAIKGSAVSLLEGVKAAVGDQIDISYAKGCDLTTSAGTFFTELEFINNDKSGFAKAIATAKKADLVLLAIGENCHQSGEGRSQTDISLKGVQMELFNEIIKVNPNVAVILMNGRPMIINEIAEKAPAILETWFGGSQTGHAIADVVFGKYNPSGKLPMTFPRSVGQIPIYYNNMNTGRPGPNEDVFWSHYTDEKNSPLYPFGYGLSYTTFSYGDLKVDKVSEQEVSVEVTVTNTGSLAGEEVAQLYIRDKVATLVRPLKELKGFQKVMLETGASQKISFTLTEKDLGYYNNQGKWVVEAGEFDIMVGGSSETTLKETISLSFEKGI
ncbi:beta-glucosidase BglX [Marinoscillum sp. MHG1-6]|uniref:beta-glucosidase BglX n=1 Tax=Marinoscillum sp. MHG1-6 TaxID=2959627 RepID=UPI002157EBB8|nr:beta-glucosidase BglX [Marinoscillum sp. MHG1-6]